MEFDYPLDGKLSADEFYVLHVEDENYDYIRQIVARCLEPYHLKMRWTKVENKEDALNLMEKVSLEESSGRGFDAIFCDLEIPGGIDDAVAKIDHGFAVAAKARTYGWPAPIIGLTAYPKREDVLQWKRSAFTNSESGGAATGIFDEFMGKPAQGPSGVSESKLKRCLIPTARFVKKAEEWIPPSFLGKSMWSVLRSLIQLADQDVVGWPLPRVLLRGETGSGKGMLARLYYDLLKEFDGLRERPHDRRGPGLYVVNCASLVAEGEGGRVRLFGYRHKKATNASLHVTPGVFELASAYPHRVSGDFAPDGATPIYAAGGVVFLDEFVTMNKDLQAAVLNALDDGVVHRQDGSRVEIGCHVLFATNASSEEISTTMRGDLLDRIPYQLSVPPLISRLDEIPWLIKSFARHRLYQMAGRKQPLENFNVEIAPSATHIIEEGVRTGVITSIRQLQEIATVRAGEAEISDGNLQVLVRDIIQKKNSEKTQVSDDTKASREKTDRKDEIYSLLPGGLLKDGLPAVTRDAIAFLQKLLQGERLDSNREFPTTRIGKERKRRFHFMLIFLQPDMIEKLTGKSAAAVRAAISRAAKGPNIDTTSEDEVVAYLLSEFV